MGQGSRPTASTTARGYGPAHQAERARHTPTVNAGLAHCAQPICLYPDRWIPPGTPWDLGHTDDRTGWIGPTHRRCNQQAGASKGGQTTNHRRHGRPRPKPQPWHSRHW